MPRSTPSWRDDPTDAGGGTRRPAGRRSPTPSTRPRPGSCWHALAGAGPRGRYAPWPAASVSLSTPSCWHPTLDAYFEVLPEIWASRGDHMKRAARGQPVPLPGRVPGAGPADRRVPRRGAARPGHGARTDRPAGHRRPRAALAGPCGLSRIGGCGAASARRAYRHERGLISPWLSTGGLIDGRGCRCAVAEITRAETSERARLLRVESLRRRARPDPRRARCSVGVGDPVRAAPSRARPPTST